MHFLFYKLYKKRKKPTKISLCQLNFHCFQHTQASLFTKSLRGHYDNIRKTQTPQYKDNLLIYIFTPHAVYKGQPSRNWNNNDSGFFLPITCCYLFNFYKFVLLQTSLISLNLDGSLKKLIY